ncbi:MAG: hypothetical protein K2X47_14280 [Bdellovibrionales bacterium]|nr:hypothetical protein [Bdellovibrionales bacterium]
MGNSRVFFCALFLTCSTSFGDGAAILESKNNLISPLDPGWIAVEYTNNVTGPASEETMPENFYEESEDHQNYLKVENALATGFRFDSDSSATMVSKWNWIPGQEKQVVPLDSYLRVNHESFVSGDLLNIAADFRVGFATSPTSIEHGLIMSFASEQYATYEIPKTRFTVGVISFLQGNVFQHVKVREEDHLELRVSPLVQYRFSDILSAVAAYEWTSKQSHFSDLSSQHQDGSLLEAGVAWTALPKLNILFKLFSRARTPSEPEPIMFGTQLNWVLL